MLLSEQNAAWALSIARRAVIVELGRITMTGVATRASLEDPRVQKAYLGI